ncbi:hypothetical protein EDD11_004638 [Mortierella claussenii]|nr:hypothetical protein EDD11_004638 [Mortierella claussenii]
MHRKVRSAAGNSLRRAPKALAADEPTEEVSESIRILCDAMQEANVTMVREGPPVFLASTYQQAEQAMEIFTEYYEVTHGGIGPVGFDTETTTLFLRPQTGTSLVQIATDDVCLMFQVNRITKWNTDRSLFPSRLRAFLESPTQIMVGVGARNDAYQLKHYYGVSCAGIVGLEVMAAGKKLLARSLAELDALYGRPGREVIKSKAIVRCDWDKANMNPGWVWYAAKDAFAGLAIFNNMRAGTLKKGHKSFAELYPLAEAEEMADITGFLRRALRKQKTLGGVETLLRRDYTRFRKMYQPEERAEHAKKYIRLLLQRGRLRILDGQDVSSDLDSNHMVKLEMCPLSKILTTPEAIQALSPYFGNQTLDLSTLRDKTIMSLMSRHFERTPSETKKQLDEQDLRIFVELADSWDYPRKSGALNKYYWYLVFNTVVSREKILDTDMPAVTETDQDATRTQVESQFEPLKEDTSHSVDATLEGSTEVSMDAALEEVTKDEMDAALEDLSLNRSSKSKGTHVVQTMSAISDEDHIRAVRLWLGFIGRMRRRGVLIQTDDVVYVSPEIERALLETIPLPPPSPLLCPNTATSAVDGEEGDPSKIEQQPFA